MRIEIGDTLLVSPRRPGKGTYDAKIVIIDPVIDASSGTFGVRADLPNPNLSIPAGLICDVSLYTDPG